MLPRLYSAPFVSYVIEFVKSGFSYAYMGLRILDHFALVESLRQSLLQQDVLELALELLESDSHDVVLSTLSLLTGLLTAAEVESFLNKGGLKLMCKLLVNKDIEFLFFILRILDLVLSCESRIRQQILKVGLPDLLNRNLNHNSDLQKSPVLYGVTRRVKAEIEIYEKLLRRSLTS